MSGAWSANADDARVQRQDDERDAAGELGVVEPFWDDISNLDRLHHGLPTETTDHTSWGVWWFVIMFAGLATIGGAAAIILIAIHITKALNS